eukprot:GHRR01019577.1.p1 GENE.GHRR01019577.1~~GHRR01019577.1.p1  ORF type:complete len:285 (+),score=137.61 GHRR01019577.1:828-1682(+)
MSAAGYAASQPYAQQFTQQVAAAQQQPMAAQHAGDTDYDPYSEQLGPFWEQQKHEVSQVGSDIAEFKNHQLPLARIKKIMKSDEDVRMISAEAPVLFAKACEMFILEMTLRSWVHAEENRRRTLQRSDVATAIARHEILDFLADVLPLVEESKEGGSSAAADGAGPSPSAAAGQAAGVVPAMHGASPSGISTHAAGSMGHGMYFPYGPAVGMAGTDDTQAADVMQGTMPGMPASLIYQQQATELLALQGQQWPGAITGQAAGADAAAGQVPRSAPGSYHVSDGS